MKKEKAVTHDELKRAIGKFVKNGGLIEKLPAQKGVMYKTIGGKWSTTEMGGE